MPETAPTSSVTPDPATTSAASRVDRAVEETTTTLPPAVTDSTTTTIAAPVDGVTESVTEEVPVVAPVLVELPVHGRGPARVVAGVPTRINALVREAIAVNDEMLIRLNDAQTQNRATSVAATRAQERVDRLSSRERRAMVKLDAARLMFEDRVRWAYTRGPTASLEGFLQSRTAAQLTGRKAMVQFVLEQDTAAVSRYLELRNDVGAAVTTASDRLEIAERAHARTQLAENEARADAALTTLVVSMWNRARRGPRDLVFPVVGTYAFGSDFGAPRMVGSPDEHQHQGNDIAAPLGAQLVAVEPGMVVAMGNDRLGGIKLWLAGRSGTYYYYAHLVSFAPEIHEGDIVPAGAVLGFVGNTGNARGGIPHLHFEIHPAAGPAVDPYPYLAAARAAATNGEVALRTSGRQQVRRHRDEVRVVLDDPSRPERRRSPLVVVGLASTIAPEPRGSLDAENRDVGQPGCGHLAGQLADPVEERGGEPSRLLLGVGVGATREVSLDHRTEAVVRDVPAGQPVEQRRESRDRRRGDDAAGAGHPSRFGQHADTIVPRHQVVERSHHQDYVELPVPMGKVPAVALLDVVGPFLTGLLDVERNRIEQRHRVPAA